MQLLGEPERAKPLYEQVLPILRRQLKVQQYLDAGAVWYRVAEAELGRAMNRASVGWADPGLRPGEAQLHVAMLGFPPE